MLECVLQLRTQKQFEPGWFYVHFKGKDIKLSNRLLEVKTTIFVTFGEDMEKSFTVIDLLKSPHFTFKLIILPQEVCAYLFSSG